MPAGIRVLLAVDSPGAAARRLERESDRIETVTEASAEESLDRLRRSDVDCVVGDALPLLRSVRAEFPGLPFVLFTASGSEEAAREAFLAGATDYLSEESTADPYAALATRVREAVERTRPDGSYREIFESVGIGLAILDPGTGEFVEVNRRGCELLGYDRSDVVGLDVDDLTADVGEPSPEGVREAIRTATETGSSTFEWPGRTAAGDARWMEVTATLVSIDGRERLLVSLRDIDERRDYEDRLEEMRSRIGLALSETDSIIWEWDVREDAFTRHGPTERLYADVGGGLGTTMEDFYERLHPDDRAELREAIESALASGEGYRVEYRIGSGDDVRWFRTQAEVYTDDAGDPVQLIGLATDVTELKRRERELQRINDRMTLAVKGSDSWIWEWDLDSGTILQSALTDLLGVDDDEVERPIEDFLDDLPPEDREAVLEARDRAIETDEPYRVEFRLRGDDEVRWIESRGQVYAADAGDPDRIIGIATDVTERKERERDLSLFRELLDRSGEAVFVSDPETARILDVNETAAERLGYDRDELIGMSILDIQPDISDMDAWREHVERLREEDDVFFEGRHRRSDGSSFPVEINAAAITTGGDEYVVGVARDIAHRKERERELQRQIDRLDRFASVVSHDLRNPLNVAQGRIEMALESGDQEHLETARDALERIEALVDDLLTLARKGQSVDEFEPVDLSAIVDRCWHVVDSADAELVVEDDCEIEADEDRLRQLIENLLGNAVEHGGEGVTVRVGALADGFFVEDDGPGVPPEERERVFEASFTTADEGTGFGLNIVREIAEAHGWSVEAVEGRDGGARFEVRDV